MNIQRQLERAVAQLDEELARGDIDTAEYDAEVRELQRAAMDAVQEEAEQEAMNAYDRAMYGDS